MTFIKTLAMAEKSISDFYDIVNESEREREKEMKQNHNHLFYVHEDQRCLFWSFHHNCFYLYGKEVILLQE